MHILITGAAGMIGRKLTERLVVDRALNGQPIDKLTLIDIVAPARPASFSDHVKTRAADLNEPGVAAKAVSRAAGRDLPSRRRGVGRGRARSREGLPRQSRRLARAARSDPRSRRRLQAARGVHLVDGGVRRAVPARHPRRFPPDAADLLRHAEGDGRADARRLHAARHPRRRRHPAALDRGAARQAQQGGVRLLLRHHPRAAGRRRRRSCRSPKRVVHTHASPRSAVGFLIHAAGLDRATSSGRASTSTCRACAARSASRSRRCAASPATRSRRASAASRTS